MITFSISSDVVVSTMNNFHLFKNQAAEETFCWRMNRRDSTMRTTVLPSVAVTARKMLEEKMNNKNGV